VIVNKNKTTTFVKSFGKEFFFIAFLFLFASCVGTVDDKNPETTKGASAGEKIIRFDGIVDAYGISHDKVEVLFFPAQALATQITYVVTYDGLAVPYTFPGETLSPDYRGMLKAVVPGLAINTNYNFQVQAIENETGIQSSSDKSVQAKTNSNITANFWGIANVSNLSGADGRNAVRVQWAAAERQGSDFVKKEIDPVNYEIVLLDADQLTPGSFDDGTQPNIKRKVVLVDGKKISHQVNGLKAGTKYFVRVQAIHHGYSLYGADPTYLRESNTRYMEIETLGDNASDIEVDLGTVDVQNGQGDAGLTSFNVTWDLAQGAFDHYRIYYKKKSEGASWNTYKSGKDDVCNGQETNDPAWLCKKIPYTQVAATISDLSPFTDYDVFVTICLNVTCGPAAGANFLEYQTNPPYNTDPGTAAFAGIEEIQQPKYYWALGEIYLKFTPPDLSTGVADGLLVEVKERSGAAEGPIAADTFLNHPTDANGTELFVPPFDFANDDEVIVRGIIPGAVDDYCFSLIPYIWKDVAGTPTVEERRAGEVITCIKPRVQAPTAEEFLGIDQFNIDSGISAVTLSWLTPSGGIYDKFVIWIRNDGGVFNFAEARANNAAYTRYEVPFGTSTFTAPFLATGNYKFGVLTQFSGTGDYSEDVPASVVNVDIP
jgi:hypothetical protein